jgi:hypothetical protein
VRGWWSRDIEGITDRQGEKFTYTFGDAHDCTMELVKVDQDQIVWKVTYNRFDPNLVKDSEEWVGCKVIFDISKDGDKTKLVFTHKGLVPQLECYHLCQPAWTTYVQSSLSSLITAGKGYPNEKK